MTKKLSGHQVKALVIANTINDWFEPYYSEFRKVFRPDFTAQILEREGFLESRKVVKDGGRNVTEYRFLRMSKAQILAKLSVLESEFSNHRERFAASKRMLELWNDDIWPQLPKGYKVTGKMHEAFDRWDNWHANSHLSVSLPTVLQHIRNTVNKHL